MRMHLLTLLVISLLASSAQAADWGTLKGKLVFDGKADEPKPINVNKDIEYCKKHSPMEEILVVDEDGGIANVVVYLYVKKGKSVDIHPDMEAVGEPATLDNKGCRFEPHVLMIRTGQELKVLNSDEGVGHNTNATMLANASFNEQVTSGSPLVKKFEKREGLPMTVACNIHPWMKAYLLVRDNPYMAVTNEKGEFEVKNIPAGKHEFIFWHEAKGNIRSLKVGGTKTSRKGRAKLTIPAGNVLDLGEVKVSGKTLGI